MPLLSGLVGCSTVLHTSSCRCDPTPHWGVYGKQSINVSHVYFSLSLSNQ